MVSALIFLNAGDVVFGKYRLMGVASVEMVPPTAVSAEPGGAAKANDMTNKVQKHCADRMRLDFMGNPLGTAIGLRLGKAGSKAIGYLFFVEVGLHWGGI